MDYSDEIIGLPDDAADTTVNGSVGNQISDITENVVNEKVKTSNKCFNIAFDEEALKAGFKAPFTLYVDISNFRSKGELISELCEIWDNIKDKYTDKNIENNFQRWVCKTLSLSSDIFSNPDVMKDEISKVEDTIINARDAKVTVEVEPAEVKEFDLNEVAHN